MRVWDAKNANERFRIEPGFDLFIPKGLAFSSDGKLLTSGGMIWNTETGRNVKKLRSGAVFDVEFSSDGKTLADTDGKKITLWDSASFRQIGMLEAKEFKPYGIEFSPDGARIVGKDLARALIWDVATRKIVADWQRGAGPGVPFTTAVFAPRGRFLVGGRTDAIRVWSIEKQEVIQTVEVPDAAHLVFSSDGKTLAVAGSTKERRFITFVKLFEFRPADSSVPE